jgi:hypothetical protein
MSKSSKKVYPIIYLDVGVSKQSVRLLFPFERT